MSKPVRSCEPGTDPRETIIARLEAAGATLLALRLSVRPSGIRCAWPETVHDAIEGYGWENFRGESADMQATIPSATAITAMDEALAWVTLIPRDRYVLRRVVHARALVNPLTERHLYSWRRVGRLVGADYRAVQRWHADGIEIIHRALNRISPCQTDQNMRVFTSSSRTRAVAA